MRCLEISFPVEGAVAKAVLLEDKAPHTCQAIWDQLERPLEVDAKHAMWTGPEVSMQIARSPARCAGSSPE